MRTTFAVRRLALVMSVLAVLAGSAMTAMTAQPTGEPTGEFVPISELPPGDQLPAAPLLIAAYAFVWVVIFVYLWSIWRRVQRVDAELDALANRVDTRRSTRP